MRKNLQATATPGLFALAGALVLLCAPAGAAGAVSPLPESNYGVRSACAAPAPGEAGCLALELVPRTAAARAHTRPLAMTLRTPIRAVSAAEGSFGLRPQDLHSAYQLPALAPSVQTIALVDAYNDPNAEADLKVYDEEFKLPPCTTANGCFRQVNQNGETGNLPFPQTQQALEEEETVCEHTKLGESLEEKTAREEACEEVAEAKGWGTEMSLDIEVAHATCQNCRIVLVEASSTSYPDFEAAEEAAVVKLNATEVSNSWGGAPPLADSSAYNHPGVVITASSGDAGYLNWDASNGFEQGYADYPASSPHVVAVGGTRLSLGAASTWADETVWNGQGAGGGGCSATFPAQPWQSSLPDWSSVGCGAYRAVADISAVADPHTGVAVYDSNSECATHWCTFGGTSLSSPLVASTFALAGGAHGVEYPAKTPYENALKAPGSLHDVVSGSNGKCSKPPKTGGLAGCTAAEEAATSCSGHLICLAVSGYDGPSGVGTPNGLAAFTPWAEESPKAPAKPAVTTPKGGGEEVGKPGNSGSAIPVPIVQLSGLRLTPKAVAALNRGRPKVSLVAFAFTVNVPARVRATLAVRVRVRGHARWRQLPYSLTITASRGRNSRHLTARGALAPGVYQLTLTPVHGKTRSMVFQIG
jgi:hypothetical protein